MSSSSSSSSSSVSSRCKSPELGHIPVYTPMTPLVEQVTQDPRFDKLPQITEDPRHFEALVESLNSSLPCENPAYWSMGVQGSQEELNRELQTAQTLESKQEEYQISQKHPIRKQKEEEVEEKEDTWQEYEEFDNAEHDGDLNTEFHLLVSLYLLGCAAYHLQNHALANVALQIFTKSANLLNKFNLVLYGHSGPQLSDEDIQKAKHLAILKLPMDTDCTEYIVAPDTLEQFAKAACNLCHEIIQKTTFDMNQNKKSSKSSTKELQSKVLIKITKQLGSVLSHITKKIDGYRHQKHKYMNMETMDYADLTEYEKKMNRRKRKL